MEKVAKLAKASEESEKFDREKSQYFQQMASAFEKQKESESKEEYFSRVYNDSSPLDRVLEFLIFKREAEKLLPELRDELVKIVRHHFRMDEALANLKLEKRLENEETPLLDTWCKTRHEFFLHTCSPCSSMPPLLQTSQEAA